MFDVYLIDHINKIIELRTNLDYFEAEEISYSYFDPDGSKDYVWFNVGTEPIGLPNYEIIKS